MTTCHLISKQCLKIKSSIVDTNNCLNEIFPAFDSLNQELSLGFCLIDTFYYQEVADVLPSIRLQRKPFP